LDVGRQNRAGRSSERGGQQQSREKRDFVYRRRDGAKHGNSHQNLQARRERTIDFRKVSTRGPA